MQWDPMWGISILADFRPMGYKLSCCDSLLFESVLGHCVLLTMIISEFAVVQENSLFIVFGIKLFILGF